ncbi:malonate decarboxylase epsilon subunit [Alteribacillus persepolensis]|uniref:Malonyl CoA-acyl carrier protein transacylase n=1 Tax=Alteribacillus persepolensis TaxID=568899 RepID=A0A1G8EAW0_9BACI|nr:malonate decarboxylase subunit epsilon [Alteribacillus persepolensis]SDH66987.1 malonate decarboxylase epsilon subunit [Alteribacillus persepolensis]
MSIAFLCPGQGSQQPGMFEQLPDHPYVQKTLQEAEDILQTDISLFDTKAQLQSTTTVQLALFIWSMAVYRAFKSEGYTPDMAAGHSVGAFGAAVITGALAFRDALPLVQKRGEWMEKQHPSGYGMGVVTGLSYRQMTTLLEEYERDETMYLANVNADDQFTISGEVSTLESFLTAAAAEGARKAERLNVAVPSHCVLMKEVSEKMESALQTVSFSSPTIPYAGNTKPRALLNTEKMKDDLAESISHTVRWNEVMHLYYERGARLFIELSPQAVLSDLINKQSSEIRGISVSHGYEDCCLLMERYSLK